jgi:tetratricopeptide (TPR) repeat protein
MTFCWSLNSMAQRDYTISYYPYVNNAEMAIIDEKYALALKYYEFAFDFVEHGFARDYLNAAYCAIEISQYSLAISYLEKLVAKGVQRKYFERNKQLAILYGHGFEEFLENVKSIREQTFEHTENRLFYGRMGQMENLEQEFRLDFEKNRDTIRKIDISNAKELFQMIDKYGFPSEEAMGLEDPFNPLAGYSHLLLVHAIKNRRGDSISYPDFIGPIREAVTNGRLNNQLAAQYLDLTNSAIGGLGNLASTEAIYFGNEHDTLYILSYDSSKSTIKVKPILE